MLPTPRTQPYRAGAPREVNAVLQAMLAGRQPGVVNEGDFARQRSQMQAGLGDLALQHLQQLQQQRRRPPMATADVRGAFGHPAAQPAWGDIQHLLAGLMGPQAQQPGIARY